VGKHLLKEKGEYEHMFFKNKVTIDENIKRNNDRCHKNGKWNNFYD
jgi:hypothetical protein